MSLKVLVALESRKIFRRNLRDLAFSGFCLTTLVLALYLVLAESVIRSPLWNQVDKWIHFLLFGFFTLTFLAYGRRRFFIRFEPLIRILLTNLVLFAAGVGAEVFHLSVPHCSFDWNDMAANLLGIVVFGVPYLYARPFSADLNHGILFGSKISEDPSLSTLRIRKRSGDNRIYPKGKTHYRNTHLFLS